ncbi:MAG: hypothetical protein H8E32_13955 [Nitrospinae bacterium]|nr:hypothetical protein [Nitrospinota bacterium]
MGYVRHLLDYLTLNGCLEKVGKDTYGILPKGVDMVIGEYQHTVAVLEKVIQKQSKDQERTINEIQRLRLRKEKIAQTVRN